MSERREQGRESEGVERAPRCSWITIRINVRDWQWQISCFACADGTGLRCYCCGQTAGGSGGAAAAEQTHASPALHLYPFATHLYSMAFSDVICHWDIQSPNKLSSTVKRIPVFSLFPPSVYSMCICNCTVTSKGINKSIGTASVQIQLSKSKWTQPANPHFHHSIILINVSVIYSHFKKHS